MSERTDKSKSVDEMVIRIMKSVPTAPILSDEYIADLLKKQAQNYHMTNSNNNNKTQTSVNKTFLTNTILTTESHNKREEIAECYRQHELSKIVDKDIKYNNKRSSNHNSISTSNNIHKANDESLRDYWIERKAKQFKNGFLSLNDDDTSVLNETSVRSTNIDSLEIDDTMSRSTNNDNLKKRNKKDKKSKKKKNKKDKKEKH